MPLLLIVYHLLSKGLGALSGSFFTTDPTGNTFFKSASIGGVKSAILGTIEIVALASAIAIPIGLGVAVWLVEYGKDSRFAHVVRFFVDVLTGVPSILFGLFIYIVLIIGTGSSYAGYKGALALSLLMLPIVTRSAEVVLLLVPSGLREAALALGAPRWRVIFRVVLPTAASGLLTGMLLAVARAAGETAPLLFTAGATLKTNFSLNGFMNSLPVQIYSDVTSPTAVDRTARVGCRAHARRHDIAAECPRPPHLAKEPPGMSVPRPTPAADVEPEPNPELQEPLARTLGPGARRGAGARARRRRRTPTG